MSFICTQVAPVLRSPRPINFQLVIRSTSFYGCDMSNANFAGTALDGFNPSYVVFDGADFTGVTGYDVVSWEGNAWWRAAKIDNDMLSYLIKNYPYDPKSDYYYNNRGISKDDYDANVSRLAKQNAALLDAAVKVKQ